jgi:Flp pilus assembly protein TadD
MRRTESPLSAGWRFFQSGKYVEAEAVVSDSLALRPEQPKLWQLCGLARYRRGDYAGAELALERAVRGGSLIPAAEFALAACYRRRGRTDVAKWMMLDLAQRRDCPSEVLTKVAAELGRLGEVRPALNACRRLSARDPRSSAAQFGVGYYLDRLGRPLESIEPHLRRAYELAPENVVFRTALGLLYARMQRFAPANELLAGVSLAEVNWPCTVERMMAVAEKNGDWRRALECRARLLQIGAQTALEESGISA